MRYNVDGLEIRTENSAKTASQASDYLVRWLRSRPTVRRATDLGCGKLRYAAPLQCIAQSVAYVDFEVQLSARRQ